MTGRLNSSSILRRISFRQQPANGARDIRDISRMQLFAPDTLCIAWNPAIARMATPAAAMAGRIRKPPVLRPARHSTMLFGEHGCKGRTAATEAFPTGGGDNASHGADPEPGSP